MGRRGWHRVDAGGLAGPNEQHIARSVVDDKAGGVAQAVGAKPGTVPVAGSHQKVSAVTSLDHLTLGVPASVEQFDVTAPKLRRAGRKQRRRLFGHGFSSVFSRVAMMPVERSPEQSSRGGLGRF